MATLKIQEFRSMDSAKQGTTLLKLREEQMNLRFQKATGQMEKPNRWREVRTEIARLKMAMGSTSAASVKATPTKAKATKKETK